MAVFLVALLVPLARPQGVAAEESGGGLPPEQMANRDAVNAISSEVDRLLFLQDQTARGDTAAAKSQKPLLLSIGQALQTLPNPKDPAIVPLVVAYVLSGGNPESATQFSRIEGISGRDKQLLEASTAFMHGDRETSAKLFAKLDHLALPGRISGRVSLARAMLEKDDMQQEHYAYAIASMPGTLIEESALRRSAMALAEARDEARLWRRVERYARRFPLSLYADSFWFDFLAEIIKWSHSDSAPNLERLDSAISVLPVSQRQRIYIALARGAAVATLPSLTDFAGRRVERLAAEGSPEQKLGKFYVALFAVVSSNGGEALRRLQSLDRSTLTSSEQALLQAALAVGRQIEQPPSIRPPGYTDEKAERSPLEERGASLLKETSQLLTKAN